MTLDSLNISQILRDGSTTYYSVDSLDSQIRGSLLDYEVSVEETKKPADSHTAIVNKEFTWGFDDGSCQIAKRGTNELLFNGYSKSLVEKYLVDNGVSNVYKAPVAQYHPLLQYSQVIRLLLRQMTQHLIHRKTRHRQLALHRV